MKSTLLADLMRERLSVAFLAGIAGLQLVLVWFGVQAWQCPLLHATGYPCPGCGLSRAAVALLRGEWKLSLTLHAFAPILLAALALVGIASFLPQQSRQRLIYTVEKFEKRTGLTVILAIGLLVYWIIRLLFPASLALVVQR